MADSKSERCSAELLRLALPAGACALLGWTYCFPVTCTDIWWHLAAGRKMIEQHALLRRDPFAADVLGQPWLNLHWLFQLLAYGAYRLGGVAGIVLGKAAVASVAVWLLFRASEESADARTEPAASAGRLLDKALVVLLITPSLYLTRFLVLERPVVLTLVLLSAFLLILERHLSRPATSERFGRLWVLFPLQVIWWNAQGGLAMLGPAVLGAYLAGLAVPRLKRDHAPSVPLRPLAIVLLGLLACGLLTPYGPRSLALPFKLFGRIVPSGTAVFSSNVSENVPTSVLERSGQATSFKWIAAASFATFLLQSPSGPALARLFLLAGFFVLALMANRNLLLFHWLAGFVAFSNIAPRLRDLHHRAARRRAVLPALLTLAALAALLGLGLHRRRARVDEGPAASVAPFRVPQQAVERLRALDLPGRVFNAVRYGGYLAWALHPRYRPGIDGRLVLRSAASLAEHLRVLDEPDSFDAYRAARDIRIALVPTAYPDRYVGLAARLYRDPRWRLLYTDGTETLFAFELERARPAAVELSSPATVRRILEELGARYRSLPRAHELAVLHLGRLLAEVGALESARQVLAGRTSAGAQSLLARVHYLAGRRAEARAVARALLRERPDDPDSLHLLALIALDEGRPEEALQLARTALELDPYDSQARGIVERLTREAGRH